MKIFDLSFVEEVSDAASASVAGGYAQYFARANGYARSAGPNAVVDTSTTGYANRGENFAEASSSSSSIGFASITTPVPASLTL